MIKRALISVSDKTGIVELGKALKHFQVEILSTGGTQTTLESANIPIRSISDYTGFPEMMDGRLKTIHPKVAGSLLGRRDNPQDLDHAKTYGIEWVDLVVVNLYPFAEVANTANASWSELVENIDIGGVGLIRAAAKNHAFVTVVTNPKDYAKVIQRLKENPQDPFDHQFRWQMAYEAFKYTAIYDSVISETLSGFKWDGTQLEKQAFPVYHSIHGKLLAGLRYGENPHQKAAHYKLTHPSEPVPFSESLQGKELSYNNLLDVDAAWNTLCELPLQSTVIIKHNNPCGIATGKTLLESFKRAFDADPESAFGGIVAMSGEIDGDLAQLISENFFEVILAERFSIEARELFQKKKNLRLVQLPRIPETEVTHKKTFDLRRITGGYLLQDTNHLARFSDTILGPDAIVVSERKPTEEELAGMRFAWVVSKNCKSNAVVISNDQQTLGIGCGQVNRRFASESAAQHAKRHPSILKVAASDGFFPFADSLDILRTAGVTAIVQPGGSIRDQEVIDGCNRLGMAMIFTKTRHFLH